MEFYLDVNFYFEFKFYYLGEMISNSFLILGLLKK